MNQRSSFTNDIHRVLSLSEPKRAKGITKMASLFSKIRIVTLGNLHEFLDAVVDLNSPAAVKQYVRDLEDAITQIEHAADTQEGSLRTTADDLTAAARVAKTLDADINTLLADDNLSNDHLALPLQVKLDAANGRTEELVGRKALTEAMLAKLNEAISKLNAKHADMVSQLESLESMVEAGKGMETAAKAVEAAGAMSVDAPSVDNLARRVKDKYNKQGAAFDRAMGKLATATENDAAVASAEAALARRKAELAAKKQGA